MRADRSSRARRRGDADAGSAVVEFALLIVVAIVPLAWAALALAQLTSVHASAQSAAGEAVRAFTTADSAAQAHGRADVAARLALAETAAVTDIDVEVRCGPEGCLRPGSAVAVELVVRAELPEIPVLGVRPAVTARAEQYGVVDAYAAPR